MRWRLKVSRDLHCLMLAGSEFHVCGAATENARRASSGRGRVNNSTKLSSGLLLVGGLIFFSRIFQLTGSIHQTADNQLIETVDLLTVSRSQMVPLSAGMSFPLWSWSCKNARLHHCYIPSKSYQWNGCLAKFRCLVIPRPR